MAATGRASGDPAGPTYTQTTLEPRKRLESFLRHRESGSNRFYVTAKAARIVF